MIIRNAFLVLNNNWVFFPYNQQIRNIPLCSISIGTKIASFKNLIGGEKYYLSILFQSKSFLKKPATLVTKVYLLPQVDLQKPSKLKVRYLFFLNFITLRNDTTVRRRRGLPVWSQDEPISRLAASMPTQTSNREENSGADKWIQKVIEDIKFSLLSRGKPLEDELVPVNTHFSVMSK